MNLPQYTPESWVLYYLPNSKNESFGKIMGGQLLEGSEAEGWMYFIETPPSDSYTSIREENIIALADTKNGQWARKQVDKDDIDLDS